MIQDCSWDYAATLMDPFSGPIGCYPDPYALPSTRVRVRKIGTFTCGTQGCGFVCFDPVLAMCNSVACAFETTNAYTGAAFATAGTGVVASNMVQSMYASSDFASGAGGTQGRVIAAGVRVQYVGKLTNTNGRLLAYEDSDHFNLDTQPFNNLAVKPGVTVEAVAAGKAYVARSSGPKDPTERDYTGQLVADSRGAYLGCIVMGTTDDVYSYECSVVFELIGRLNNTPLPAKQDPVGLAHVSSVINSLGPHAFNTVKDSAIWGRLLQGVSTAAKVALAGSMAASTPGVSGLLRTLQTPGLGLTARSFM